MREIVIITKQLKENVFYSDSVNKAYKEMDSNKIFLKKLFTRIYIF